MPRVLSSFDISPVTPHVEATSTGTADVKDVVAPAGATAFLVTVATTSARMTVDGSAPSTTNGLIIPLAAQPLLIPIGHPRTARFASAVAGTSVVDVLWLV